MSSQKAQEDSKKAYGIASMALAVTIAVALLQVAFQLWGVTRVVFVN